MERAANDVRADAAPRRLVTLVRVVTMQTMMRGATLLAVLFALPVAAGAQGPAGDLGDPVTGQPAPRLSAPAPAVSGPAQRGATTERGNAGDGYAAVPEAPRYGQGLVPPPPGYQAGADPMEMEVANRLRALDGTWAALSTSGGPDIGNAVMSLVGAGLEIAIGSLLLEFGDPGLESMAAYLFVLGGTTVARTVIVEFILRPDPRGPAIEYMNMPVHPRSAALERLEYGETQLRALAERAWIARMVDGSLNIAGALAVVPAYLAPRNFTLASPLEAFIFIGPAFALISGIITLASTTALEQRWAAYDRMRTELRSRRATQEEAELLLAPVSGPSVAFDLSIDPQGGGVAFMRGTF